MNNISVVVFDLGNVLLPFDYEIIKKQFNEIEAGLGDKFVKLYSENYKLHREFERADISVDDFIAIMLDWLEGKVDREKFCHVYGSLFTLNKNVAELLPKLKENYQLVLLSNTNQIHRDYGWGDQEFLKYFDKLILSYEVCAYKPEEKIYKAAEAFTEKPSEEHIFIDDIADYIEGAKKLGWDGIQFIGYENLVSELTKRNIRF